MVTHKDLVEAQAFARRRLVAAFVRGDPGGVEVEPPRPNRLLVGGLALTVALVAGAAAVAFATGRPDPGWLDEGSFVVSEDTGQQYVVLRGRSSTGGMPVVQRVPNHLSAQLLLGEPDPEAHTVADRHIREVEQGADLGIAAAPVGLPGPEGLLGSGWTACTSGGGIRVALSEVPGVRLLDGSAFLVRARRSGAMWLVAPTSRGEGEEVRRFGLPDDPTAVATLAERLGFGTLEQAPVVDDDWLDLFPRGPSLTRDRFGLRRAGPADYPAIIPDLSRFRVGELVRTPDGRTYLLGDDGPQQLDEFAALVHEAVASPPHELRSAIRAVFARPGYPAQWPRTVPGAAHAGDLCAMLQPDGVGGSRVVLATDARGPASPDGVPAGVRRVHVDPTGGAYVRSDADEDDGETAYVIGPQGAKHALRGPSVADHLGYGETPVPAVPAAWLDLLDDGVPLSVQAALAGP